MNDDLSSKLQQLKDMLSDDQMQDKLKSMMSIMPNIPNMQNTEENTSNHNQHSSSNFNLSENEIMLSKFMKIMDKKKHLNDPRINLLTAIKPYLSQNRQVKIDSYSKIFSFSQLASLLKDEDL